MAHRRSTYHRLSDDEANIISHVMKHHDTRPTGTLSEGVATALFFAALVAITFLV